jgi:hypothetical protein
VADSLEARRAQAVHGHAWNARGQARQQQGHSRDVAVVLARLVGAAEHDLVERLPVHLGATPHQRCDGQRGKIVGSDARERAAVAPERRSHPRTQEDWSHGLLHAPVSA